MRHVINKIGFDLCDFFLLHHIIDGNNIDPQNREQGQNRSEQHR